MELAQAAEDFVLGMLNPADLRRIAKAALELGSNSPALTRLAASEECESEVVNGLFVQTLDELRINLPSPAQAGYSLARRIALQIVLSQISPYEGARRIWREVFARFPELTQLRAFVGFASEYEDDEPHRDEYAHLILQEAKLLLRS